MSVAIGPEQLGLYALALQQERRYWLRSRCELVPEQGDSQLEIAGGNGGAFSLGNADEVREQLLNKAIEEADALGVHWQRTVLRLRPTEELEKLVELSDALRPEEGEDTTDQEVGDASAKG